MRWVKIRLRDNSLLGREGAKRMFIKDKQLLI